MGAEETWRPTVVEELARSEGDDRIDRVLDVGCGTGTLALTLARSLPRAVVAGVDPDPDVLRRARATAARQPEVRVEWRRGSALALPFADGTFQRVSCTLVLHRLLPDRKLAALQEIRRVLSPRGRTVVADWGPPQDPVMRTAFFGLQLLHGFRETAEHARGLLPARMDAAGLNEVTCVQRVRTRWGTLEVLTARA